MGLEVGEASYEVPTAGVLRVDVLAGNRSGGKPLPLSAGRVPRTGSDDPFSPGEKKTTLQTAGPWPLDAEYSATRIGHLCKPAPAP